MYDLVDENIRAALGLVASVLIRFISVSSYCTQYVSAVNCFLSDN